VTLEDDVTTLSRNVDKCLSNYPASYLRKGGSYAESAEKNSASVGFNFLRAMLLDIQFCWDVNPCLRVVSRTAVT
jgi:hypothetical protein